MDIIRFWVGFYPFNILLDIGEFLFYSEHITHRLRLLEHLQQAILLSFVRLKS